MLSREHGIVNYDWQRQSVIPDRLTRRTHQQYPMHAARMLAIYRGGVGRTRQWLHRQIEHVLADESDCPVRRIHAFCKLLDDVSSFQRDRAAKAARLRREVFRRAAASHPLVSAADSLFESQEEAVKQRLAEELGTSWEAIDAQLFADVIEFQQLQSFAGYPSAEALLARYNVAQVQVALYDALDVTIRVRDDLKRVLRAVKLARLMHTLQRLPDQSGYDIRIDGPAAVLRGTRRYGVSMARFVPALLACRGWTLQARLSGLNRREFALRLSPQDRLSSHLAASDEFDSELERRFCERWGDQPRDGWTLQRESVILHQGQRTFVPDFEFRHVSGRSVLLEVVGYWTPEYLAAKQETLAVFSTAPIVLVLPSDVPWSESVATRVIRYKSSIGLGDVLDSLHQLLSDEETGNLHHA